MSVYGAPQVDSPRFDDSARDYDAVLILSFGGPEGMDDVIPFLENVTRGRNIPRARLEAVAEHYYHFGGVSPINAQNRALIAALQAELQVHGIDLPIYFGNRNWHPLITDTIRQMRDDGVQRAIAFFTSAFSSYSGCRQYRENIIAACESIEGAPAIDKLRAFYNHPGFIQPMAENVRISLAQLPTPEQAIVVFTAHSIPLSMARGSAYEAQLQEACRLVAESIGLAPERYRLVYQSRSGAPHLPWLEPDILDTLDHLHADGVDQVVIAPIGFISDHMEVMYDLDTEAVEKAQDLDMTLIRAPTVGIAPAFIAMIRALIMERMSDGPERLALGSRGPTHDICPLNCCRPG